MGHTEQIIMLEITVKMMDINILLWLAVFHQVYHLMVVMIWRVMYGSGVMTGGESIIIGTVHRGIPPIKYEDINIKEESVNA